MSTAQKVDHDGCRPTRTVRALATLDADPINAPVAFESFPLFCIGTTAFNTTIATEDHELQAAGELVRRRYSWRGYDVQAHGAQPHACGTRRAQLTLIASQAATPLGTLTLCPDGPNGLEADVCYGRELDAARAAGHRIGEVTRFALEAGIESKPVLASLFHAVHWVLRFHHELTHFFVEVNPRHVAFYRRTLGFVVAGSGRMCPRVQAPSVLLQVPIEDFGYRVAAFCDRVFGQTFDELAAQAS